MKIMVLNDGTTFSNLQGCHIVEVPDNSSTDDIEDFLRGLWVTCIDQRGVRDLGGYDDKGKFIKEKI